MRPGVRDRLDFELHVREVPGGFARAAYDPNENLFPERYGPQAGDIVHRRPDRPVSLAVQPFGIQGDAAPADAAAAGRPRGLGLPNAMRNAQPPQQRGQAGQRNFENEKKNVVHVAKLAKDFEGKLRQALQGPCKVPLADAETATHLLYGQVTFSDTDYQMPAQLIVKERATGNIVRALDFKFTEQEGQSWKP